MIRSGLIVFLGLSLSACASIGREPALPSPTPVASSSAAQMAARLAADLDNRSRQSPASLEAVEDEMRRLAVRLAAPAEPLPEPDPVAPDPVGGTSLFHAIHLASYRVEGNAIAGWESLQMLFPGLLASRQARLEAVELGSRGEFLRLKAGPFDTRADARSACAIIEAGGGWCAVTDFTGRDLPR
jgi:hypothetical protein